MTRPPDRIAYTNRPELVPLAPGPGGAQRLVPANFHAEWDLAGGAVARATYKVVDEVAALQTASMEVAETPTDRQSALNPADLWSDLEATAQAALEAAALTAGPTELVIRPWPFTVRSLSDEGERDLQRAWAAYSRATREGRSTLAEIQEELGVSRSTATRMVRKMRERGDLPPKGTAR
jgi:Winged helix-turn-helix DNA-binding